jgi:hypothetical protein
MTLASTDGLLIVGLLVSTVSLWLIIKSSPAPVKIKKDRK